MHVDVIIGLLNCLDSNEMSCNLDFRLMYFHFYFKEATKILKKAMIRNWCDQDQSLALNTQGQVVQNFVSLMSSFRPQLVK